MAARWCAIVAATTMNPAGSTMTRLPKPDRGRFAGTTKQTKE